MVIVQCEACNRIIYSDEEFYTLNKSRCPSDVVLEIYPPERKHFCNECINKALDLLVPDIQKDIMARFDELVENLKENKNESDSK